MHTLISTYLIFFKIGAVSFGGGYAMLPFIEEEIIKRAHYLTYNEFLG
ncbi:MAG: chromate transporter, partial [Peptoanaerobacter stomatis]